MRAPIALALLLTACGNSPVSPTPQPSPSPVQAPSPAPAPSTVTITAALTATVGGASAGSFTATVDRLPALVSVSAAGYLTRQAYIGSLTPHVDLIALAAPFDLSFYRQLARNGYEAPTALQPIAVLTQNPSIYLETNGLSASDVNQIEQAARNIVPIWSAEKLAVAAFVSGAALQSDAAGWITIETVSDPAQACGRSYVGAPTGHIWLNLGRPQDCTRTFASTISHELGHALGYWHVADPTCLMSEARPLSQNGLPCPAEKFHAAIAYSRQSGNRDPDNDAVTSTPLSVRSGIVVID